MKNHISIKDGFNFLNKSKIKAGDGLSAGKFPFYTSSSSQSKFLNDYEVEDESLIFGTGGSASIHYSEGKFSTSTDCFVIQSNKKYEIDLKYAYYYLIDNINLLENGFKGAGLKHISKKYLEEIKIPLVPLETQKKIIEALDKSQALIDSRKEQIRLMDDLVKSRFIEMFGDSVTNNRDFREVELDKVAQIVSGITKGRKTSESELFEVPYMSVSNVKNGYIDWTNVKKIHATKREIELYKLVPDDILMTEGGDPDKVGRGAMIRKPIDNCIHQNHIFRVRLEKALILPEYFEEYLQHSKAKRYFLSCAKQTTGIASINMGQLKRMPLLLPPIKLQQAYSNFVNKIGKTKLEIQNSHDELITTQQAIMQQYFG